jgi:hypothetical protein
VTRCLAADTREVTSRMWMAVGLTIAAVAFGGWRLAVPGSDATDDAVGQAVGNVVDAVVQSSFTAAEASLRVRLGQTGTFAGEILPAPLRLARADARSYCIEYDRPPILQHLAGPGGAIAPGPC